MHSAGQRARFTASALLLLWAAAAGAQPEAPGAPTVTIRSDAKEVELGEPFEVVVTVVRPPTLEINLPVRLDLGNEFMEMDDRRGHTETLPGGQLRDTFVLKVAALRVGEQMFPPIPVIYTVAGEPREVLTSGLALTVKSVVGDGEEELRPVAPPVPVTVKDYTLVWITAALLAGGGLLAAGWLWLQRRRRHRRVLAAAEVADHRPPHVIALERLGELANSSLLEAEDRRPFYFEVTDVVRDYLGRRYGFDALELTSAELLEALDRTAGGFAIRTEIETWLAHCDLVKYARTPASREEAVRMLEEAVSFVERTRPAEPAPAPGVTEEVRRAG